VKDTVMNNHRQTESQDMAVKQAPKFSIRNMDRKTNPRKDFYQYAAGGWIRTHPVPADRSRWGSFSEVYEWNLVLLRNIVEQCASDKVAPKGSEERLVGDFYRSAMDTKRIEALRFAPVEDLWRLVENISSSEELVTSIPKLHSSGLFPFYNSYSKADDKNSSVYAYFLGQGGLSLPDREYYLSDNFLTLRKQYEAHVKRTLAMKGIPPKEASKSAKAVLAIETALAKSSRTRTELRDREKNYNRMGMAALESRYQNLAPLSYLEGIGVRGAAYVVVGQPEFFDSLASLVKKGELDGWKGYLCWQVLNSFAPFLHREIELENFDFFQRKVQGQAKLEPRWKRAVEAVDSMIGEALGKLYVRKHFPEEARRRASVLVDDLRLVFRERLAALPWMAEATRKSALAKFEAFTVKIGHPEKFRDYSTLEIRPDDFAGNVLRSSSFEFHRLTARVGSPVDRKEWFMTPPTVNAYFEETTNEIVFPAGILQPSFFDPEMDDAVNYGSIGVVIGHEITHGYDDQGRHYDAQGNLKDWWTLADAKEFGKRARAVVKAYSAQEALPGKYVNGELTLGENIADLGGVSIAYEALERRLEQEPAKRRPIDGMTPEQRFFVSHAQTWRLTIRPREAERLLTIDPHSPGKVRGTLPVVNHPAFDEAFPPDPRGKRLGRVEPKIGVW